jgi:hypothetical protein
MRRTIQTLGLILAMTAIGLWLARGGNRGWTKTSVPIKTVDEVTGIEGIRYQKRFVPGIDFLGAALIGAGVLEGLALLIRRPKNRPATI